MSKTKPKRRLVKGKDWHRWAFADEKGRYVRVWPIKPDADEIRHMAEMYGLKLVRVRFVEVE